MTNDLRVLVIGAGATGGYFGGRLAQAGRDVTFLVRPARAAQLTADGLRIVSEHGDAQLRPRLISAGQIDGPYDLILLTVKAFALAQAMTDFAPAVGPTTLILPTLNGLRHIDELTARFGASSVLGGVCVVSTTVDEQGRIVQLSGIQELSYGRLPDAATASGETPDGHQPDGDEPDVDVTVQAADRTLRDAGFATRLTADILPAMWQKWIMLASVGALNCLMRGTVGEVVAAPGGTAFATDLLAETAAVAEAAGFRLRDAGRDFIARTMTTPGSPFTSSMFRDLQQGQRVEVDAIIADLVTRAERLAVAVPLLRLALTHLSVYQGRLG